MKRLFVRHAPVLVEGLCYGHAEVPTVPLSQLASQFDGCVAALRSALDGAPASIVSSPSLRCSSLAYEIARVLGVVTPLRLDLRLRELGMGDWEGRTWQEIRERDSERLGRWMEDWQNLAPPGGESPEQLRVRVRACLREQQPEQTWIVVTHAGVIRAHWVDRGDHDWVGAMEQPVPNLALVVSDDTQAVDTTL